MSTDETNAYLQAKMQQQAQVPELSEAPKKTSASKTTKKAQTQSDEQPQPMLDVQAFRQMVQDVISAELQTLHLEQPQPLDMQTLRQAMHSVVRAELQPIQAALTLLANAVQAQAEALTGENEEMEEDDSLLPTASSHNTDEEMEDEHEFPAYDEETEEDEGEEDDDLIESLPRPPEPPTHKLRRPEGPGVLLLGGIHPTDGVRRWEPQA